MVATVAAVCDRRWNSGDVRSHGSTVMTAATNFITPLAQSAFNQRFVFPAARAEAMVRLAGGGGELGAGPGGEVRR